MTVYEDINPGKSCEKWLCYAYAGFWDEEQGSVNKPSNTVGYRRYSIWERPTGACSDVAYCMDH